MFWGPSFVKGFFMGRQVCIKPVVCVSVMISSKPGVCVGVMML